MTSAKSEILERLRSALSDGPVPAEVERSYRRTSNRSAAEIVEQLEDRLVDYKASVTYCDTGTVADTVGRLLGEGVTYVVPAGFPSSWLPESGAGLTRIREREVGTLEAFDDGTGEAGEGARLGVRDLDAVDAVVTSSTVSCSETGTIFLSGRPDEGRRAITLVPDHHVCIVPRSSIVELIPEALERVEPTAPITMISGPSATSDIELERVEGVHGPRTLDVIILDV